MKRIYKLNEMEQYKDVYHIDENNVEWCNYNLPDGWQIGCIEDTITEGIWLAVKDGKEKEIVIK